MDNKILQEEVVETKAEVLESTENPQTMEKDEIQEEETMEYLKEDEEDMVKEDEKEMEKEKDEEETDMVEEEDEDEEDTDMVEEEDEEDTDMVEEEEEEEEMEMEKDKDYYEEGVEIDEEENMTTTTETQIQSQEESSSTALNHSERAELEAFRRERKEGLIHSFEDDLSVEFLENLTTDMNNHSFDELEVILSKEFTRVNRETKKSKPNAFIYKPEIKSTAKSEIDVVKELVQKYK